jgi:pre-mRNA-splicing factor 38A
MSRKDPSIKADASLFLDDRGYSGHLIRNAPPHLLFEEAVRNRIIDSYYWKEQCFGLNAATLCDRAVDLTFIGGTYSDGQRPTPFLCLAFKMLQLNIESEILDAYLSEGGEEFKYLRALAAFYIRLTSETSEDVYRRLEPYLEDYRKLRRRTNQGYSLTTIDEFVDDLFVKERVCATSFWKLVARQQLEDEDRLEERVSPLAHMLEEDGEEDGGEGDGGEGGSDEEEMGVNGSGANGRHEDD